MASYNNGIASALPDGRAALVIAHPGHELRALHWLRLSRPCVFVLTDGSGSFWKIEAAFYNKNS
jgi:hypothetical protein